MRRRWQFSRTVRGASPRSRPGVPRGQRPGIRLTARGGVLAVFAACFLGQRVADWANWAALAGAAFFLASSLTAYYMRAGGLLPVVVSAPLLFFAACVLEKALTGPGPRTALAGTLVMLGHCAPWLFEGTGVTLAIALLRGLRTEVRALALALRA